MAIRSVGVVGCGLMGSGIAQVCAEAGHPVLVREVSDELLKKGLGRIESFLAKGVEKGKLTAERKAEVLGRLKGTTRLEDLRECDIVVEAVVESLDAKAEVFRGLDAFALCAQRGTRREGFANQIGEVAFRIGEPGLSYDGVDGDQGHFGVELQEECELH